MGVWAHWKKSHVKWLKSDGLRWGCRVWCDPSTHTQRHLWSPHGCLAQLGRPCLSSVTASKSWDSVHKAFKSTNELLLLEFKAGTKRDMRFIGNMDKGIQRPVLQTVHLPSQTLARTWPSIPGVEPRGPAGQLWFVFDAHLSLCQHLLHLLHVLGPQGPYPVSFLSLPS